MNLRQISLLPRSSATNAYDLMVDVIRAIEEEPKRINMDNYSTIKMSQVAKNKRPACGTVACVAGWMQIMRADRRTLLAYIRRGFGPMSAYDASYMLPESVRNDAYSMFQTFNFWSDELSNEPLTPGTQPYASAVADMIRDFIAKHETVLKTHVYADLPKEDDYV